MHSLGLRLLLTYHGTQLMLRRVVVSRWEIGELPCVALGAALVFGVTMLVSALSGMRTADTMLWSLGGPLIAGGWLLHALYCISNEDLEQRILSIRGALAAAAPPASERSAVAAPPCEEQAVPAPVPPAIQPDASIPSAQPAQATTEGDSLAAFLNSVNAGPRQSHISRHTESTREPSVLVGCFAFMLSVPIGVTIAAIISMALFPQANGAAPAGLAVFCCYWTYQILPGMFGRK